MPRVFYVNGAYLPAAEAAVSVEDRGLQFADSVYEVFAMIGGTIADERGHLDRLEYSLKSLGISMPVSRRALRLILREVARRNALANASLYVQVTRGAAPRDFKIPKDVRPGLIVTAKPMSFDVERRKLIAKTAVTVPDIRWARRDIKTTQLLAQVLAKRAAELRGADEALMVDAEGYVTEASASNAWIVDAKGQLITRPAKGGVILKGVTRTAMQALCRKEGLKIVERAFTPAEAYRAREAFTSSANMLFCSLVRIDGRKIGDGKPGPVMRALYDLYMDYADRPLKQVKWVKP